MHIKRNGKKDPTQKEIHNKWIITKACVIKPLDSEWPTITNDHSKRTILITFKKLKKVLCEIFENNWLHQLAY